MRDTRFGWDYPPGCSSVPGDEPDQPCEVCGVNENACICVECPVCGIQGNPDCYLDDWRGGHGLKLSNEQKIGKAKLDITILQNQISDIQEYIGHLEAEAIQEVPNEELDNKRLISKLRRQGEE